ncbi:MAG: cell division protein FtsZ [Candidatus Gastranaerophilaceae bacterium]
MYDNFSAQDDLSPAKIKVFGVGGCGGNAVNRMITNGMQGVDFWVMNTDLQVLKLSKAQEDHRIQLGASLTHGLGAGGNPAVGENAAKESKERITEAVSGSDMVFITAGMGGGSGTGASPIVAKIAKDSGALTIAVVTKPFSFEGTRKMKFANEGLSKLKEEVDAIIVVPNERLLQVAGSKATLIDAFSLADEVLTRGVQGISDIVALPGVVNVDFADVQAIMKNSGTALMGIGIQSGEGRAVQAANASINSPLIESSLKGATGVIVNVTGGPDMTLHEINAASQVIQKEIAEDANFTFGAVINENVMNGSEIQVTVIATGFDLKPNVSEQDKAIKSLDINAIFSGKNLTTPQPSVNTANVQPAQTTNSIPVNSGLNAGNVSNSTPNTNASANNIGANTLPPNTTRNSSNSNEINLLDIPEFLQKP